MTVGQRNETREEVGRTLIKYVTSILCWEGMWLVL